MNQLDPIQSAIEKYEHVARTDIAAELRLDNRMQSVEALAHVGGLGV
jgi:hypothetical protein